MASKHLKRKRTPRANRVVTAMLIAVAFAALASAFVVHLADGNPTASQAPAAAAPSGQSLSQEGRLIAISPTSVTAQSADGFARTYAIDSQTNVITERGSLIGGAGTSFAVNDEVQIVGVVRDGTAVATAVADRELTGLNGPPMDAV